MGSCLSSQKSLEEKAGNEPVPEPAKDVSVSPKTANGELEKDQLDEAKAVEKYEQSENDELKTNVAKLSDEKNAEDAKTEEKAAESVEQTNSEGKSVEENKAEEKTTDKGDEAKNAQEASVKTNNKPSPWGKLKILPWL